MMNYTPDPQKEKRLYTQTIIAEAGGFKTIIKARCPVSPEREKALRLVDEAVSHAKKAIQNPSEQLLHVSLDNKEIAKKALEASE